jgi:hypothetical protein
VPLVEMFLSEQVDRGQSKPGIISVFEPASG